MGTGEAALVLGTGLWAAACGAPPLPAQQQLW